MNMTVSSGLKSMWTNSFLTKNHFLWIEFKVPDKRGFNLPISLLAFKTLVFSVTELLMVVTYLLPKATVQTPKQDMRMTLRQVREIVHMIEAMMLLLENAHRLDILDIETKELTMKLVLR